MGLAVTQYTQDNDEYTMMGATTDYNYVGEGWMGQILPYIQNTQVFRCPDDPGRPGVLAPAGSSYYGYCYNASLVRSVGTGSTYPKDFTKISQWVQPASTVLIYEGANYYFALVPGEASSMAGNAQYTNNVANGNGVPNGTVSYPQGVWMYSVPIQAYQRHLGGANFLCADGHVKWLQASSVSYGFPAPNTTSDAYFSGGSGTWFAQSVYYKGADAAALTLSYK